MIEFTKSEINAFRFAMVKVLADAVAECGPIQVTRTPKRFKVIRNYDQSTAKYYPNIQTVLHMISCERLAHCREWEMRYNYQDIYHHGR